MNRRICTVCGEHEPNRRRYTRGMCNGCYQRWRKHGTVTPKPLQGIELFWSQVDKTEGCWIWQGTVRKNGYGNFGNRGLFGTRMSHRIAYIDTRGPVPDGLVLDHLCRNRRCVRPDHLEPVTQQVNILRGEGVAAVNAAKAQCPAGHEYDLERDGNRRGCKQCQRDASRRNYLRRLECS